MPKRRSMLIGMGALAMGSGAAFSSASFSDSTQAGADFRVQVSEALRVEAGEAFEDDGSISEQSDKFIDPTSTGDTVGEDFYESNDLGTIFNDEDPPLATVSARGDVDDDYAGVNENLEIYVALGGDDGETNFSGLLQIVNETNQTQDIGIAYDRNKGENGQYGGDVGDGTDKISYSKVQEVYQFVNGEQLISPDPESSESTSTEWGENADDEPATLIPVDPGNTKQIELQTDLSPIFDSGSGTGELAKQADLSPGFGSNSTAVDLLDGITVVAQTQSE